MDGGGWRPLAWISLERVSTRGRAAGIKGVVQPFEKSLNFNAKL